jgi:peptidyl-prolyl cis-trans isomerase C
VLNLVEKCICLLLTFLVGLELVQKCIFHSSLFKNRYIFSVPSVFAQIFCSKNYSIPGLPPSIAYRFPILCFLGKSSWLARKRQHCRDKSRRMMTLLYLLVKLYIMFLTPTCEGSDTDSAEAIKRDRIASKVWYAQPIQLGNATLPFSPILVFVALMSVLYLYHYWAGSQSFAEASHILLSVPKPDDENEVRDLLIEYKKVIGNDYSKFSQHAKKYSVCPSGKSNGGNLGRFRKNDMTPPFDKAVFDCTNTSLNTTIGPIRTQFGWHLIYVHSRQMSK